MKPPPYDPAWEALLQEHCRLLDKICEEQKFRRKIENFGKSEDEPLKERNWPLPPLVSLDATCFVASNLPFVGQLSVPPTL